PGGGTCLQQRCLPSAQARHGELAERDIAKRPDDVTLVDVAVTLARARRERGSVLGDPTLFHRSSVGPPRAVRCCTASGPSCCRRFTSRSNTSASLFSANFR